VGDAVKATKIVALVLAGGRVDDLSVLTLLRPKAAMPFGGIYRIIDFALSNLARSGINRVGVISQYSGDSLIDHVGVGEAWDLIGRGRGVKILPPRVRSDGPGWYRGSAHAVAQNLNFVRDHAADLVLVVSGDHIYRMDYREILATHTASDADLTVAFVKLAAPVARRFGLARLGADGRVLDYQEKPERPRHDWASMTVYVFRPEALIRAVQEYVVTARGADFGRDVLPRMLADGYRVFGHRFTGEWRYARSVAEYYQAHLELLAPAPRIALDDWGVRTNLLDRHTGDRTPARLLSSSEVRDALISDGCVIAGRVERSVLSPGVQVAEGAVVRDSILFHDSVVAPGARVTRCLVDKDVTCGAGCVVGEGDAGVANRGSRVGLSCGVTLIGKTAFLPPGVRVGTNCEIFPEVLEPDFPADLVVRDGTTVRRQRREADQFEFPGF